MPVRPVHRAVRTLLAHRPLGGECACRRRPTPLRCVFARTLSGPRRRGSRRGRGRDRAALGRQRRGQDHAAAPARRAGAAVLRGGLGARARPRRRPALGPPGAGADGPRDLLLRRPHGAGEPAVRGPGVGRHRRRRRRRARAGRARAVGRHRAPQALGRAAPTPRAGGRARPATRACCCSTSRTPGSTRKAARCSTASCAPRPSEGRTVLIASHELDHTRPLADREVVLSAGQAHREAAAPAPEPARLAPDPGAGSVTHERHAGDVAGRGEGPAHRGAIARHAPAGPAVRADRAAPVRVRARSRSRDPEAGRAGPVLGDGAARGPPGGVALVRHRGRQRRTGRPAPLRSRRRRRLPREGRRARASSCCSSRSC